MTVNCNFASDNRRRLFWATQMDACGSEPGCGSSVCGCPGLTFKSEGQLETNGWISGLIINMLMTDGLVEETGCGVRPRAVGGHWSESYIESGPATIGTLMRSVKPVGRIQDNVNTITAYALATVQRLVARGIANTVEVEGTYAGDGVMHLDILVYGTSDGDTRVRLSGARLKNTWIWSDADGV